MISDVGAGPVGVDAAIFIYFIEEHVQYLPIVEPLFKEASTGRQLLITSALTLLEVLVVPYRSGNRSIAGRYETLLTSSDGVETVEISHEHLRAAAHLRATTKVRTADALQLTAALGTKCTSFVTNDRALPTVHGLRILQLSSYLHTS